jgi:chemotaxis protein MotB
MRLWKIGLLLLCLSIATGGCVSKTTYQRKVDEAASLQGRVSDLQGQVTALMAEGQKLRDQIQNLTARNANLDQKLTDARNKGAGLQADLTRCGGDIDRLEKSLAAGNKKAADALAKMRNRIDQLEKKNQDLTQQVERERVAREARIAQMKSTFNELVTQMTAEIKRGEVTISNLEGRLTVNMVEKILFDSGKAEIKPSGLKVLRRVGNILKQAKDKAIRVEGFTDNLPVSSRLKQTFPSNWELSTARATNVVHFLQDQVGIPGQKLSACGFGPYHPVADNSTAEGRAQNRRIQIVLVPMDGKVVKPLRK